MQEINCFVSTEFWKRQFMSYSRDSFYRFKELYEQGGELALQEISRKKPVVKNRVKEHIEQSVVQIAIDNPALGQVRVSNELRKKGILVSLGGVRSIWLCHDMETFQKRLKALSAKVEQEGIILDENQVAALKKAKAEKQAQGEIETYYPGFLVAQDTYYVGYKRRRAHLPADNHRHLFQNRLRQALRQEERSCYGGHAQ